MSDLTADIVSDWQRWLCHRSNICALEDCSWVD